MNQDTLTKLAIIVIGTIVAIFALNIALNLISTILPLLVIVAGAWLGFRWLRSESELSPTEELQQGATDFLNRSKQGSFLLRNALRVTGLFSRRGGNDKKAEDVVQGEANVVVQEEEEVKEATVVESVEETIDETVDTAEEITSDESTESKHSTEAILDEAQFEDKLRRLEEQAQEKPKSHG